MQTVPFPCTHCGKLMAVEKEFLGVDVRCPHCQQVVVAPPAEAEGSAETIEQPLTPDGDPEDIFAPEEPSDDLFGQSQPPRIEIPPGPLAAAPAPGDPPRPPDAVPDTMAALPLPFPPPPVNGDNSATQPAADPAAPWMAGTPIDTSPAAETPAGSALDLSADGAPAIPRPARRKEQRTPWFMILIFSPLVLYSIVVTIFAVMLYLHQRQIELERRNPFEMMPDDGDNPGVQPREKKTTRQQYIYDPRLATLPLPDNLRTRLTAEGGEPLQIGDLQITPTRVTRERVQVFVQNSEQPEPCTADSLVLYLNMKNLSSTYAFAPLDNYFDRYWRPGMDMLPPLTQLEVGTNSRFYGGPARWYPRGTENSLREWVQGRKAFEADLLEPGEEKEFFVCTDGQNEEAELVLFGEKKGQKVRAPFHGRFLWRIRVRRGLVRINGKDHSATAVVGVEFTDKDIRP